MAEGGKVLSAPKREYIVNLVCSCLRLFFFFFARPNFSGLQERGISEFGVEGGKRTVFTCQTVSYRLLRLLCLPRRLVLLAGGFCSLFVMLIPPIYGGIRLVRLYG